MPLITILTETMRLMLKPSLVVLLIALLLTTTNPHTVKACSGGAPLTIAGLINRSDYVVKARIAEVDDLYQNAIIQVENYLVGGPGPEYLLWLRNDPIFVEYVLAGRSSGGDCLGIADDRYPGQATYLFLHRTNNGSYEVVTTLFNPYEYRFPTPDSTVEVFLEGGFINGDIVYEDLAEKGSGQSVTEQEFLEIVAEQSGEEPLPPDQRQPYPLKAPLQLITASGDQYLLPVDGQQPIELTSEEILAQQQSYPLRSYGFSAAGNCVLEANCSLSPDGINVAVQTDDNTITLPQGLEIQGQAFRFSTTSDTIAVWDNCHLTIYTLGYPRLLEGWFEVTELSQWSLIGENDCSVFRRLATWSPDGRLLAFSDAQGLLLWDIFDLEAAPRLLIAASSDGVPLARSFSTRGRYLSVSQGNENFIMDVLSGDTLPDGLISPDDRLLLKFDTTESTFNLEICVIAPYSCQPIGNMHLSVLNDVGEVVRIYDNLHQVSRIEWENKNSFLVQPCVPEEHILCSLFRWQPSYFGWEGSLVDPLVRAFDFDQLNHTLAVVTDTSTIVANSAIYDLSGTLDSEIIDIQWLPSLFYHN